MAILIILSLLIHEYEKLSPVLGSLISFNNVLQFSEYKFYISFVKFVQIIFLFLMLL